MVLEPKVQSTTLSCFATSLRLDSHSFIAVDLETDAGESYGAKPQEALCTSLSLAY